MDKKPLILKELSIRKMPGFPSGMVPYEDFADHINIITGPNASGKSSTANLIRELIWQDPEGSIEATGHILIDNEPWRIHTDRFQTRTERNGVPDELTGLPPSESRAQYMLALHELVNAEDKDLAREIAKEAIGGYDPEKAGRILDYSDKIRNKGSREYTDYSKAEKHYREIFQQQQRLKKEEETLDALSRDKEQAEEAARLRNLYDLTRGFLEARQAVAVRGHDLDRFPAGMEKVSGDEFSMLTELEKEVEKANQHIEQAKIAIENSRQEIASLNLPSEEVDEGYIEELEGKTSELADYEKQLSELGSDLKEAEVSTLSALKAIDPNLNTETWEGLELDDVQELDEYLESAGNLSGRKQFLEDEVGELESSISRNSPHNSDTIMSGISTLGNWLQESQSHSGVPVKWVIIPAAAGAFTAIATLIAGMYGLSGILLVLVLTYYALKMRPASGNRIRERDYAKTGLPLPESWNTESVSKTLDTLVTALQETKNQESLILRLKFRRKELDDINRQMEGILAQEQELRKKLGAAPGIAAERLGSHSSLYWFLKNVMAWRTHHTRQKALESQQEYALERKRELLDELNAGFRFFNLEEANDAHQAKANCKTITREAGIRKRSLEEITRQGQRISEYKEMRSGKDQKLHDLYKKLGLKTGEKESVRLLTEQRGEFLEAMDAYNKAKVLCEEKKQQLISHSLYEEHQSKIEQLSVDEADALRDQYAAAASRLDDINKRITEIRTHIGLATRGQNLENALAAKDKALDELELLYEDNLSSLTGRLLVNKLRESTQTQNKSKVYADAGKLFTQVTKGRYELRLHDEGEAAFLAYDTTNQQGQPLNELSTGTRLQLLLSVRLAFIESRESLLRLPLLADELLANSDDVRAGAIMQALIAFSQNGRQVFYFTAQDDEVAKWEFILRDQAAVTRRIFHLRNGQHKERIQYGTETPFPVTGFENRRIPSPENYDHSEYGEVINVPFFNILEDRPETIHLWYLITDTELLYTCLRRNINTWGQLNSYFEHGGQLEGFTEKRLKELQKIALGLGRFLELYRKGRPRPLTMDKLLESGIITPAFREKVYRKLLEVKGNPEALLSALTRKEVPGFGDQKTQKLREFLVEHDFTGGTPLTEDEIRIRLQAYCSRLDADMHEMESFIATILSKNLDPAIQPQEKNSDQGAAIHNSDSPPDSDGLPG